MPKEAKPSISNCCKEAPADGQDDQEEAQLLKIHLSWTGKDWEFVMFNDRLVHKLFLLLWSYLSSDFNLYCGYRCCAVAVAAVLWLSQLYGGCRGCTSAVLWLSQLYCDNGNCTVAVTAVPVSTMHTMAIQKKHSFVEILHLAT
jgi:hypothetical protein